MKQRDREGEVITIRTGVAMEGSVIWTFNKVQGVFV